MADENLVLGALSRGTAVAIVKQARRLIDELLETRETHETLQSWKRDLLAAGREGNWADGVGVAAHLLSWIAEGGARCDEPASSSESSDS